MKVSVRDKEILSAFELDRDTSVAAVAKRMRMKPTSVTYSLRKLQDEGLLHKGCFINSFRLGYIQMAMYFSLIDQQQEDRSKLVERVVKHDHVLHLGSLLGDYHYLLIFLCRSLSDVSSFIQDVFVGAGDVFSEKLIAPRTSITYYQRGYLSARERKPESVELSGEPISERLDCVDEQILYALGTGPFESLRKLAKQLGLAFSTVERRFKKLQCLGVLEGPYLQVSPRGLGVQSYRLLVRQKGICCGTKERLGAFCAQHKWVTYLVESVGSWDFEIGVEAPDSNSVTQLVEELYGICRMRIANVRVLMEVEDYKCCHYPVGPS